MSDYPAPVYGKEPVPRVNGVEPVEPTSIKAVRTSLNTHEMGLPNLFGVRDSLLATPTGIEPVLPA